MFTNQKISKLFPLTFFNSPRKTNEKEMKHIDKLLKRFGSTGSTEDFFNVIRYILEEPNSNFDTDLEPLTETSLDLLCDYYHNITENPGDSYGDTELKSNIEALINFTVKIKSNDIFFYEILKYIISLDEFIKKSEIDLNNIKDASFNKLEEYYTIIQKDKTKSQHYKLMFTNILKFLAIFIENDMITLESKLIRDLLYKYFFIYQFNNVIWGHIYTICLNLRKKKKDYKWNELIDDNFLDILSLIPSENENQQLQKSFYLNFERLKDWEQEIEEEIEIYEESDDSSIGSMGSSASVEVSEIYVVDKLIEFDDMKDIKYINDHDLVKILSESKYNHEKLLERIEKNLINC